MSFADRKVLVTGGSRGLGLAIVRDLLQAGYSVATCSRRPSLAISELERSVSAERFLWLPCEIGNYQSEVSMVSHFEKWSDKLGPYALINNAGVAADGVLATFPTIDMESVLQINLVGALRISRLVLRILLRRHGPGRFVNISSIIGQRGYSGLSVYSASKAGMDGFTRSLAREVGRRQITVNSIAPGYLTTEMSKSLTAGQRSQIERRTPLGRLGGPEDVTPTIRFLLGDEAKFITGQTIVIDGGITC